MRCISSCFGSKEFAEHGIGWLCGREWLRGCEWLCGRKWLRGRVRDSRKGPWSGRHGTERTGATLR